MRPVAIASRHPNLRIDRRALTRAIHVLDSHHDQLATRNSVLHNEGELSLVFLNDAALARLHDEFLEDPSITDVITFEGNPALGTSGEICVSADAAVRHVTSGPQSGTITPPSSSALRPRRLNQEAFSRELALYVIHGWLHLAGYDDLQPAKKRVMRRAEAKALAVLERAGALPEFQWRR